MSVILISGIIISTFLFLLLLNKRTKSLSDKLLTAGIGIVALHLLNYLFYYNGTWNQYPNLIGITVPFPLLYGPLIYLYTKYSIIEGSRLSRKDYLHFVPALFSYMYMFRFFFFFTGSQKIQIINGEISDFSTFTILLMFGYVLSGIIYSVLAYSKIGMYEKVVKNNFSNQERISLQWLKYAIWSLALIFIIVATILILREGLGVQFSFNADLIFYSLIVLLIFCIGFFGIQQQNIFSNSILSDQTIMLPVSEAEYKKSGLKSEKARQIHEQLQNVMLNEKPFLNPKLTLAELAEMMQVSSNNLSQVINQYEQVNFNDFVNKYRIDEFIKRSKQQSGFSILANALDSGFNSKSSFNNVFKKIMNTTPSAYLSAFKG